MTSAFAELQTAATLTVGSSGAEYGYSFTEGVGAVSPIVFGNKLFLSLITDGPDHLVMTLGGGTTLADPGEYGHVLIMIPGYSALRIALDENVLGGTSYRGFLPSIRQYLQSNDGQSIRVILPGGESTREDSPYDITLGEGWSNISPRTYEYNTAVPLYSNLSIGPLVGGNQYLISGTCTVMEGSSPKLSVRLGNQNTPNTFDLTSTGTITQRAIAGDETGVLRWIVNDSNGTDRVVMTDLVLIDEGLPSP